MMLLEAQALKATSLALRALQVRKALQQGPRLAGKGEQNEGQGILVYGVTRERSALEHRVFQMTHMRTRKMKTRKATMACKTAERR